MSTVRHCGRVLCSTLPMLVFLAICMGVLASPALATGGSSGTGTVSGIKYKDTDGSGTRTSGEPVISGVKIYVDYNNNSSHDSGEPSATTAADGTYTIGGVAVGTWKVREVVPSGYTCTAPNPCYHTVTVSPARMYDYDYGNYKEDDVQGNAMVNVQFSTDGKSAVYMSDKGLSNYTLIRCDGTIINVESAGGSNTTYSFGPYSGPIQSLRVKAGTTNWTFFSDKCPGTAVTGKNFGNKPTTPTPPVDVCPNLDGNQSEVPAGHVMQNGQCVLPPPPADVCPNIDGNQSSVPAGMVKDANGNCVTPPADVCPNITGNQPGVPVGMHKDANGNCVPNTGSVKGKKFKDVNGNGTWDDGEPGLGGVTIYVDYNDNGQLDAGEPSDVTDADGSYEIVNVAEGAYKVREVVPSGYTCTAPSPCYHAVTIASTVATGSGAIDCPNPMNRSIETNGSGANYSGPYNSTCDGSPSLNGEGDGTATGKPCAGCKGNADNKQPQGQLPDGSDANSGYECDENQGVGQTNPAHTGCVPATPDRNFGNQLTPPTDMCPNLDGDQGSLPAGYMVDANGNCVPVDVCPNIDGNQGSIPAGMIKDANGNCVPPTGKGKITGIKFKDVDGDGVYDAGEPRLSGVTIYVDYNDNGQLDAGEPSDVTDSNGAYEIEGVERGTWKVREIVPAGYTCTTPNPCYHTVTVFGAGSVHTYTHGNYKDYDVQGNALVNVTFSASGLQATYVGDKGLSNYTVILCDGTVDNVGSVGGDQRSYTFAYSTSIQSVRVKAGTTNLTFYSDQCSGSTTVNRNFGNKPDVPVDACPNIAGNQGSIPAGMIKDDNGNCVTDECPNITGIQTSVPSGYIKDANGNCVPTDVCPNITGWQTQVPSGMVLHNGQCIPTPENKDVTLCHATGSTTTPFVVITISQYGVIGADTSGNAHDGHADDIIPPFTYWDGDSYENYPGKNWTTQGQATFNNGCVPPPVDECPNIYGNQTTVPTGMYKDAYGSCVGDECPNLTGIQTSVPAGMVKDANGNCVTDQCPNLTGIQTSVPAGLIKDAAGNCVPVDVCPNVDGNQSNVPDGMVLHNGQCIPVPEDKNVTLCHATGSTTNPFVVITISQHGVIGAPTDGNAHDGHADDIIPPFTYWDGNGYQTYPGKNWTAANQAIYNSGCVPPPVDVCPNIAGDQTSVPAGMVKDANGNCVTDECPNLTGIQSTVPAGYVKDAAGNCVEDKCPNLTGVQTTIPVGYIKDANGNCVPTDVCPNLTGDQPTVPAGMVKDANGNCVVDECPNLSGLQTSVPAGYIKDAAGNCVEDKCPNLTGAQPTVPAGYIVDAAGNCVPVDECPNLTGAQPTVPAGMVKDAAGNCVVDECPNLTGIQTTVPAGLVKDAAGNCVTDECPNLTGIQPTVPAGLVKDAAGNCVTDECPNLTGVQGTVPAGMIKDAAGNCVTDECPNITGAQPTVPAGMVKDAAGNCVEDKCPNLTGIQPTIPAGYIVDAAGNCVPVDECPNIVGAQPTVPAGMVKDANGNCVVDECPNLTGIQGSVPAGMIKDAAGNCVEDKCPNLEGVQTTLPVGWMKDANGNCVPPTDICPNIEGVQTSIPAGMIVDAAGNCVPPLDICPNIAGNQTTIPVGMIKDAAGNCVPPLDLCPNIDGAQAAVPAGMIVNAQGLCVPPPVDVCPNIDGMQDTVPAGHVVNGQGLCVPPVDKCPNIDGAQGSIPAGMVMVGGKCVKVPKGSAKLTSGSGCQKGIFTAFVKGTQIAKVTFYVDGRKIQTVVRPDAKGRYLVKINPNKYKLGVHKVKAVVTFTTVSQTKPATLTKTFYRCSLPKPPFTG